MIQIFKKIKEQLHGKWWFHSQDKNIIELILEISATIAEPFPPLLQRRFIKTFDSIGLSIYRLSNIIFSRFSPYLLLSATLKGTQKQIKVLIKGDPDSFSTITTQLCSDIKQIKKINKKKAVNWWKHPQDTSNNTIDIFIAKSDMFFKKHYKKHNCKILPEYISFHLDTTKNLNEILSTVSSDIKKDIEKAQQTGYTYQIRNDKLAFSYFYHHMYKPYMKWKHKKSNRIASYATIRHLAAQGAEILFIKHNDSNIFGGMFLEEDNMLKTHYAGLMNGKFNHLHNGVMALSYYFLIKIAKQRKCHTIDFGTAPPFMQDGLYVYKSKWNMDVVSRSPFFSDIFAVKILNRNSIIEEFIRTRPFHVLKNNEVSEYPKKNVE